MAQWMSDAKDDEEAYSIAHSIDQCWKAGLGRTLYQAWQKKYNDPKAQFRRTIRQVLTDNDVNSEDIDDITEGFGVIMYDDRAFDDVSMTELMDTLQKLQGWDKILESLSSMEIDDVDDKEVTF
jgi:hypothetical protein